MGAFISEPVFGSGGVIVPPAGYHRRMWKLCQRYDVLYISDEVVTSFGRLGHFFASQAVFGVQPDIILTAKGLTSGYQPLGACIFSRRIWEVIAEPDKDAASAMVSPARPPGGLRGGAEEDRDHRARGLLAHADEVGRYFEERLQSLRDLPIVGDVRGMRFMACVEFVADKASKALFPESLNIGEWVHLRAQKRGLLVRPIVHLNVMSPPLILTREQVDTVVRVLRESIEETVEDLVRAGHR
ncbi:aminotransferase class III-fold pyridoxal phosphate-dependent enzyme [Pseudomonas aeruginosa]|nr:aminotransferase class III-fold pyridoxal phosphate-dependent enzyme [Pseudomonas aeruginosa]